MDRFIRLYCKTRRWFCFVVNAASLLSLC